MYTTIRFWRRNTVLALPFGLSEVREGYGRALEDATVCYLLVPSTGLCVPMRMSALLRYHHMI